MKNKKICVYTCITGDYDNLNEINSEVYEENIDYYCFTNNNNIKSDTWKVIYIEDKEISNQLLARKNKILGNEIVEKYDITVWVDGNSTIKQRISKFIDKETNIDEYDIAAFKHRFRDCIYDEAIECVKMKKDKKDVIKKQIKIFQEENYPKHNGLYETGVLVRRNNNEVKEIMKIWYDFVSNYSIRDQLSLNYAIYKKKVKVFTINMNVFHNDYFEVTSHNGNYKINSYHAYFGKDDSYSEYNYDLDIYGEYIKNDYKYIAKIKVPCESNIMKFYIDHIGSIIITNIKTNFESKEKFINLEKINDRYIILNDVGCVEYKRKFQKDDEIQIEIEMKKIDSFSYNVILKSFLDNDREQEKYIKMLERKNRDQKRIIRARNKDYANVNYEFNNLINAYHDMENNHKDLEKNYNNLNDKYNDISKKYNDVINSKGWQILEKIRKLKSK